MEDSTLPVSPQAIYTANLSPYMDQTSKGGTQLSTGNLSLLLWAEYCVNAEKQQFYPCAPALALTNPD